MQVYLHEPTRAQPPPQTMLGAIRQGWGALLRKFGQNSAPASPPPKPAPKPAPRIEEGRKAMDIVRDIESDSESFDSDWGI
jgi:hypothetical protein